MKTLFEPIHSLSHLLHDAADVDLRRPRNVGVHALLSTQLHEEANSVTVSVPVPGLSKDDLSVYIEHNVLVVSTKDQPAVRQQPGAMKHRALQYSFILPAGLDTDRAQAKCRNGLLTITLEKTEKHKKHTVINVLGQENSRKHPWRLNTVWDKIKAKLDTRKIIPTRSVTYS